jgi:hypothetical protein
MSVEDIQMANKKRKLDNGTTFCQKCWQIAKFCEKKNTENIFTTQMLQFDRKLYKDVIF